MFYCEKCAKKNKWPEGFVHSYGKCECCGDTAICSDVPSKYLLDPPQRRYYHLDPERYER